MSLYDMAFKLQKEETKLTTPKASDPILPPSHDSKSAILLSELEEEKGFDRSSPSMEYKGSEANREYVRNAIREKYGEEEAESYEPCIQVKPKTEWLKLGYIPIEVQPLCLVPTVRKGVTIDCALWHINQCRKD